MQSNPILLQVLVVAFVSLSYQTWAFTPCPLTRMAESQLFATVPRGNSDKKRIGSVYIPRDDPENPNRNKPDFYIFQPYWWSAHEGEEEKENDDDDDK